jgi:hypothetical protein
MVAPARRRLVALGMLRSLTAAVALYYLLLDHLATVPLAVILAVGMVAPKDAASTIT